MENPAPARTRPTLLKFCGVGWIIFLTGSVLCVSLCAQITESPPPLAVPRVNPTIMVRSDGKVYIASDRTNPPADPFLDLELYDPAAGSSLLPSHPGLGLPNNSEFCTSVTRDRVLLCRLSNCSLFDPATTSWTKYTIFAGNGDFAKLQDGNVLRGGGGGATQAARATLIDPETLSSTDAGTMVFPRTEPGFLLLGDGRLLALGGVGFQGIFIVFNLYSAEAFDPATRTWSTISPPLSGQGGLGIRTLTLRDGRGLAGGSSAPQAQVYDPATNAWKEIPGLSFPSEARGAQLPNGTVMVAGVGNADETLLWDLGGVARPGRRMAIPRSDFGIATLLDGTVIAMGGTTLGKPTASVEVLSYGQPKANLTLKPNFYVVTATENSSRDDGVWGLAATIPGATTGGVFFGGLLSAQGADAPYAAFTIGETQTVAIHADFFALPGSGGSLMETIRVLDSNRNPVPNAGASGASSITWSGQLTPGFYIVELRSDANAAAAAFNASISATRLLGGASAGGTLQWSAGVTGYLAFAVGQQQDATIQVYNEQTFGIPRGAQNVILSAYDGSGKLLKKLAPGGFDLTAAPETETLSYCPTWRELIREYNDRRRSVGRTGAGPRDNGECELCRLD